MSVEDRLSDSAPASARATGTAATGNTYAGKLYVDATGLLPLLGFPVSGIARVQDYLVRQSLEDKDASTGPVVFDVSRNAFRELTVRELALFDSKDTDWPSADAGPLVKLRKMLRLARSNPHLKRDFDRLAATRITGKRSTHPAYIVCKTVVRLYRLACRSMTLRQATNTTPPLDRDIVLFPDPIGLGHSFQAAISACRHRAFICHDVIPSQSPELVGSDNHALEFTERLTQLLNEGAHALCVSEATRKALSRFVGGTGHSGLRSVAVPMPSILYDHATSAGSLDRQISEDPFVIYCSTIEVRKNHILLARIWKRAIDEGVNLPRLVCVGKWGWKVDELRTFIAANPQLTGHVDFVGQAGDCDLIELYRGALFGVMPSRDEGWGLGASECLDFGLPVVVSTAPALQEAVQGLMPAIDPDDQDAWYDEIRRLSFDDTYRAGLSARIRSRYKPVRPAESWRAIKALVRNADVNRACS